MTKMDRTVHQRAPTPARSSHCHRPTPTSTGPPQEQPVVPDHPDHEQLAAFQAGDVDRRERLDVEAHLAGCASCATARRSWRFAIATASVHPRQHGGAPGKRCPASS